MRQFKFLNDNKKDDYITTDRIEDILSSVFDDTIDSIRQLIVEVNLHTRDNETI